MADQGEISKPITQDAWREYASKGKIQELDDVLVDQFGLIQPEATSSFTDPVKYADDLRRFFVDGYNLGENKLRDMYVVRRIALGLKEAAAKFNAKGNVLDAVQFEDGITAGFQILAENYANADAGRAGYYNDFDDPELVISMFGPVMEILPREKTEKVLNVVTNEEAGRVIMDKFKGGT